MTTVADFEEEIDLTIEPWKTLAPLCWNCPSPFRLGAMAEEHGVSVNPYTKRHTIGLFNEGRESYKQYEKFFGKPDQATSDSR